MSELPEHERLSKLYQVICTTQQEVNGDRRIGLVVGADPTRDELSWITLGMDHPVPRATRSLTRVDLPDNARELLLLITKAGELGMHWGYKTYAQAAFALEQEYWPCGIFFLTMAARMQHEKLQEKRAIATLSLGLPFYEALPPHLRAIADDGSPEIKAIAKARRIRSSKIRLPTPSREAAKICANEVRAALKNISVEHPGFRAFAMKSLVANRATAEQRRDSLTMPLQSAIVAGHETDIFFTVYGGRHDQIVVSEDGELRSLPADQVEIDDDPAMKADGAELQSILDYAWRDGSSVAFWLGSGLASKLGNADADIFWMVYGARWQNQLGNKREARAIFRNALVAFLALDIDAMDRLRQRFTDLAEAAPLYESGGDVSAVALGSVEELANHWDPAYSIAAMAKALYPEPGLFDDLVEVFSFGPAPFDRGALPPPKAGEPNPYGVNAPFWEEEEDWPSESAPDPAPSAAPETTESRPQIASADIGLDLAPLEEVPAPSVAAPPSAVTHAAPPTTAVICSEHCLLQTDWEIPAGVGAFLAARECAFAWLSEKIGTTIPPRWAEGANEAEHRGFRLETEAGEGLVAIRYEHPDHALVGRRWRAEIGIGQGLPGSPGVVAIRLLALDSTRLDTPTTATPRLIRDLMNSPGLYFAGRPASAPWEVASAADMQDLSNRLRNPERDYSIVVCPLRGRVTLSKPAAPMALQVHLADAELAAYVASFGPMGPGDLHLFAPGNTTPEPLPKASPKAVEAALMRAGAQRINLPPIPTFAEVRRRLRDLSLTRYMRQAQAANAAAESTSDEVATMSELMELLEAELATAQAEKRALESDFDLVSNELREAKAALYAARAGQAGATVENPPETLATPQKFAEIEGWLPALGDRVRVSPKAIREALGLVDYQNQGTVLATIAAMYEHYWPMVFNGDAAARERWQAFLRDNRLRCGPVGTAGESSRYEDAYQAVVDGRTYSLNLHIQGPSVRDIRRCLRIYFTTDKKAKTVVIGTFPLHKPSTLT